MFHDASDDVQRDVGGECQPLHQFFNYSHHSFTRLFSLIPGALEWGKSFGLMGRAMSVSGDRGHLKQSAPVAAYFSRPSCVGQPVEMCAPCRHILAQAHKLCSQTTPFSLPFLHGSGASVLNHAPGTLRLLPVQLPAVPRWKKSKPL